jgi:hypothetical protein
VCTCHGEFITTPVRHGGPRRNPNYRPDCEGDIQAGSLYVEYLGEAGSYQSGSRYCQTCGIAVWGLVS